MHGLCLVVMCGLLTAGTSLVVGMGSRAWVQLWHWLSYPWRVESSCTRDQTWSSVLTGRCLTTGSPGKSVELISFIVKSWFVLVFLKIEV